MMHAPALATETVATKHGRFTIYTRDQYVGASLRAYGEYSEDEVCIFKAVLRPGDVALEIGSNIGALTVPMARLCKTVYAFEPQPENFKLLHSNIRGNGIDNVTTLQRALGDRPAQTHVRHLGELGHDNFGCVELGDGAGKTDVDTIDGWSAVLGVKINFIKIDVEGMELQVLQGAEQTIKRDRPILYLENDRAEKSAELIAWLLDAHYRCYWHRPPLYHGANHNGAQRDIFGGIVSINMLCMPEEAGHHVGGLDEVADARIDPQMYAREFDRTMRHLGRKPDDLELRFKAAHFANLQGNTTTARQLIADNLAIDPEHVGTRAVRGLLDLQAGNFRDGWPAYELRYKQKHAAGFGFREHSAPHWDGRATDEPVLIWGEQGFGDSIMFARFMREALRRAPNAMLEIQPQLFELFELSYIAPRLFRYGRVKPAYAWHCSLPSLPATLGLCTEDDVKAAPYLRADRAMIASWLARPTPRIGICCKGGVASERAYSRDIPQALIEPLAKRFGPFLSLENSGQWESYADTAAAISALDMVLTVDTSIAHLAGALGVKTILMLSSDPDWRWQRDRADCPWYPHMQIVRQNRFMDWSNVISEIEVALDAAAGR